MLWTLAARLGRLVSFGMVLAVPRILADEVSPLAPYTSLLNLGVVGLFMFLILTDKIGTNFERDRLRTDLAETRKQLADLTTTTREEITKPAIEMTRLLPQMTTGVDRFASNLDRLVSTTDRLVDLSARQERKRPT